MRDWLNRFFYGRQGMDELSKTLFWSGIAFLALAIGAGVLHIGFLNGLLRWLAIFQLIAAFFRAFSRNLMQRESENYAFLQLKAKKRAEREAAKDRAAQRKDYRFFKCPGCKTWLRVPRGKGKIHIKCKCGYTLYRKT